MFGLIFDSHPDLVVTHEAHFVAGLAVDYPSRLRREGLIADCSRRACRPRQLPPPRPSMSEVDEKLSRSNPDNYADAVVRVRAVCIDREDSLR